MRVRVGTVSGDMTDQDTKTENLRCTFTPVCHKLGTKTK